MNRFTPTERSRLRVILTDHQGCVVWADTLACSAARTVEPAAGLTSWSDASPAFAGIDRNAPRPPEAARTAIASVERILAEVAHELRTPLASIRALTEFLVSSPSIDNDLWRRYVDRIHSVGIAMSQTVENLLDAARLQAAAPHRTWAQVDLDRICRNAVEIVSPIASPNVSLQRHIASGASTMRGDSEALQRLVVNLLANACRHTRVGVVRVEAFRDAAFVVIRVSDTGSGMDPDTLARLGRPFALAGLRTGRHDAGGVGLGLSICRHIAAAHGGEISVESSPGHGSTVAARLRPDLSAPLEFNEPAPIRIVGAQRNPA